METEPRFRQALSQRSTVNKFGDNKLRACPPDFMNRDNVRMIESRRSARLLFKTAHALRIDGEVWGQ